MLIAFPIIAQTTPFIGYDKVAWGSSVEAVRAAYTIGNNVKLQNDPKRRNVVFLLQKDVSKSIKQREFYFYEGKLYRVWVTYRDADYSTYNALKNQIQQKYGEPTDFAQDTGRKTEVGIEIVFSKPIPTIRTVDYTAEHIIYGHFSPDIEIDLVRTVYVQISVFWENTIQVSYTWRKLRDQLMGSELDL
jgi:hypothetical protein